MKANRTEEAREVITCNLFSVFALFVRELSVYIAPAITREDTLSTDAVHVQSIFNATAHTDTAFVLISIIRYPGAGGYILPSRIAHAWSPRDNGSNGIPRNSQRVPDPSFFPDQKALNSRNFWCLMTSRISVRILWRCNARAAVFWDSIYPNEPSGLRKTRGWKVQSCKNRRSLVATWSDITGWYFILWLHRIILLKYICAHAIAIICML